MTDVLPQMRHFLKEGPITKTILAKRYEPFYRKWMLSVNVISAVQHSPTHTQMTFQFRVLPEYLNPGGTLHGAGQSLFFDACTTMLLGPIARPPEFWTTYGTSRSLNVVYFRPAFEGDLLTLECETVNVSKRLAMLRGVLKRQDGALISSCEHQMYNVDADTLRL